MIFKFRNKHQRSPDPRPGQETPDGQVMMEFCFSMILLMVMFWGLLQIFRWTGVDLAERRIQHDQSLIRKDFDRNWGECKQFNGPICLEFGTVEEGNLKQVDPYFYRPAKLNAVWSGGGQGL